MCEFGGIGLDGSWFPDRRASRRMIASPGRSPAPARSSGKPGAVSAGEVPGAVEPGGPAATQLKPEQDGHQPLEAAGGPDASAPLGAKGRLPLEPGGSHLELSSGVAGESLGP